MLFPDPLRPAVLVRRYKRFLADVAFPDGATETVHVANPGSMLGLDAPGTRVWLSPARNPARKLRWSWELSEVAGALVGINTGHPNAIVAEALLAGRVPELAAYRQLRREVRYGRQSRVDMLLAGDGLPDCYVEVKNVHLMRTPGLAEFPDSVTARGARHLAELGDAAEAGHRAVMFFLVQRTDCDRFALAADIDPAYAAAWTRARARGVEAICHSCTISMQGIELGRRIDIA